MSRDRTVLCIKVRQLALAAAAHAAVEAWQTGWALREQVGLAQGGPLVRHHGLIADNGLGG